MKTVMTMTHTRWFQLVVEVGGIRPRTVRWTWILHHHIHHPHHHLPTLLHLYLVHKTPWQLILPYFKNTWKLRDQNTISFYKNYNRIHGFHTNSLADLGGACPGHAPFMDPILSFLHTFSLKSTLVRGPRPPNGSTPPTGNPRSAAGICYHLQENINCRLNS